MLGHKLRQLCDSKAVMVAIIFEFVWVCYLTTLSVAKIIQRVRLKSESV
jgi:hypothetical protein